MKNTKSTEKGIESLNREFRQYEQVRKDQVYHLSEHPDQEEFDTDFEIKSVDFRLFTNDKIRFVTELGSALEEIGFAIITNHGIDPNLYHKAEQQIIFNDGSWYVGSSAFEFEADCWFSARLNCDHGVATATGSR
jgi:hypothetical protein